MMREIGLSGKFAKRFTAEELHEHLIIKLMEQGEYKTAIESLNVDKILEIERLKVRQLELAAQMVSCCIIICFCSCTTPQLIIIIYP